jgi:predicted RNA-binding Zn-ribbon protein involved in translation (DUF1610 family)
VSIFGMCLVSVYATCSFACATHLSTLFFNGKHVFKFAPSGTSSIKAGRQVVRVSQVFNYCTTCGMVLLTSANYTATLFFCTTCGMVASVSVTGACTFKLDYSLSRWHTLHSTACGLPVSVIKGLSRVRLFNNQSPLLKSGKYHSRNYKPIFSQHPKIRLYAPSTAINLLVAVCIRLRCFNTGKPPQNDKKDYIYARSLTFRQNL